jgi:hypothetical protein
MKQTIQKSFNKLESFIFGVGSMKNVNKALFKSILTLIGSISSLIAVISYVGLDMKLRALGYVLSFVIMSLLFISFATQYRTFKFLSKFKGGVDATKS